MVNITFSFNDLWHLRVFGNSFSLCDGKNKTLAIRYALDERMALKVYDTINPFFLGLFGRVRWSEVVTV